MEKIKKLIPIFTIAITILAALLPLYFNQGFISDFGDPIGQTIPNKFLAIQYLKNGLLPLWNPFSFLGFPLLADIQVGVFYLPDLLIFSIFPPLVAHNISILFHLIFAGLGTYFLMKSLTQNKLIATAASAMLILGGAFLTKIVYLNFLETIVFIPWILLLITQKKPRIWLMTVLFAFMIFAGHPIALIYGLIIIGLFFIINYPAQWRVIVPSFILSLIIAAIQILPFLELKINSVRDALSYTQFTEGSLSFQNLWGLIVPWKNGLPNPFDTYIHFGTIAFIMLPLSVVFFKYFSKTGRPSDRKIYFTGIVLCIAGILFSLGENIPFLAKIFYSIPPFNLMRVPARYSILFHFGALLCIAIFLKFISQKYKKIGATLAILILINSLFIPSFFLKRHEISQAEQQYFPEIKEALENKDAAPFSLFTAPQYSLSSSFFLFPNRHILSFMPNVIGYNPLILKDFYNNFSVLPIGAFKNPEYFTELYEKFQEIGLQYFIFPNKNFLKNKNLESKNTVIDFLQNHQWQKIIEKENYDIWQSSFKTDFVHFLNDNDIITSVKFAPGKITLTTSTKMENTLIANQIYYPGWVAVTDKNERIPAEKYHGYLQSYSIPANTETITLMYNPKSVIYGFYLSLAGIGILTLLLIFERKKHPSPLHDQKNSQ